MTTLFTFLQGEWPAVYEAASKAASAAHPDPRTACFYARRALELAVAWAYKFDASLRLPYQDNLSALIHEPTFKAVAGEAVFSKARVINTLGNQAVHSTRPIQPLDAADGRARAVPRGLLARPHLCAPRPPRSGSGLRRQRAAEDRADPQADHRPAAEAGGGAARARREAVRPPGGQVGAGRGADSACAPRWPRRRRRARPSPIRTTTPRRRPATTSSTCCSRRPGGRSTSRATASSRSAACPTSRARASSITCCGATTASRWRWSRPSAPRSRRTSASSRPSSMPTAWNSSSGSARSSSTRTATSTGSGTTPPTRRGRCRASSRRPSWS